MPEPTEKTEEKPGNLPEEVTKVLEELKVKLDDQNNPKEEPEPKAPSGPTWQEQREADRKALGFTEEQMQAHERTVSRAQAPVIENTGWAKIEKKTDIETFRKEIEAEL